jgi:hypothetical protein
MGSSEVAGMGIGSHIHQAAISAAMPAMTIYMVMKEMIAFMVVRVMKPGELSK